MKILDRLMLMKMHALLATFILPVAIMFFVTGAFYTWGIKGAYNASSYELHLQKPIQDKYAELVSIVTNELQNKQIDLPSGKAEIKRMDNAYRLEWTGANKDIVLQPTENPLIATLEIKNTSWYRHFVQLHKAKGGTAFKFYAAIFATAMLLLLISGFMMAWQTPQLRKLALISTSLGVVTFIAMVMAS
jgi:hypothetical protein